jgi:multidrug resistance protein
LAKRNKSSLTIIFVTVFIDLVGFGILIPILPTFATKEIHISDFQIGIVVAIYSFMQFLFNPIMGKVSDKIGRKPVIIFSLFLNSVSYVIFAFTNSFLLLLFSRVIAGIGGSNIGVAQAYIADITSKHNRSKGMGVIGAAFGLGFVFGPLIGGMLSKYGYEVVGFLAAGFSFLAFLFALFILPESLHKDLRISHTSNKVFDLKSAIEVMKMPRVGFLVFLFFILIFAIANIYGTFALLGYKLYHFTDSQNGMLFGIMGLIGALVQGVGLKRLVDKFLDRSLLLYGSLFMGFGLLMIPYGKNFLGVALIVSFMSIGTGILQPVVLSMISKFSPQERQGAVLGINQSISAFARVLGPLWGGWTFQYIGFEFPFITGAFFTFISFGLIYFMLKNEVSTS